MLANCIYDSSQMYPIFQFSPISCDTTHYSIRLALRHKKVLQAHLSYSLLQSWSHLSLLDRNSEWRPLIMVAAHCRLKVTWGRGVTVPWKKVALSTASQPAFGEVNEEVRMGPQTK